MTDKALEAARECLDQTICECGHTESAHVFEPDECHGEGDETCDEQCREYRPVKFKVERLNV